MGWVVAILIVALLGNLYLFSGYDVEGDIAGFMVGIAVLVDLIIVGYTIFMIVDKVKSKAKEVGNTNLSEKKQLVVNELKTQLIHKQEILRRFDSYFLKKQRVFSLMSLVSKCNESSSQTIIDAFNRSQTSAFEQLKGDIIPSLTKEEKKLFPTTIDDFSKYKIKLDQEIDHLKKQITSVASADKLKVHEIIEEACPILHKENRKKKIRIIWSCLVAAVIIIAITIIGNYSSNAPYRDIQSKIDNQTLTVEMLDWKNRETEGSYYEYIHSEKGYKFLANVFSKLHQNDDIEKAMWLLCVQPDCIDGMDLCASDAFIDWVVDYAKENGTKKEQSDGDITYSVDGYEITISSIFDYSIGHSFYITNGKESTSVEKRNPYHDGTVPTIK